jgi:protein gp37
MADKTLIAWTDHTANFWMGCMKVSPGCANCYAETLTTNRMGLKVWGPAKTTERQAVKNVYGNLRKWNRETKNGAPSVQGEGMPHLVFVGSLMDWAEDHPMLDAIRRRMWHEIRMHEYLHFQMLTKRPERIPDLLPPFWDEIKGRVWLGTSVEDMKVAERADHLRQMHGDCAITFISYEPALGPLDDLDMSGIDWLIFGGESGPGFRAADLNWARTMRERAAREGWVFFFKQSSHLHTERGIELDGEIVRPFPTALQVSGSAGSMVAPNFTNT